MNAALPTALIIDDDANECLLLSELAKLEGFNVVIASTAAEILTRLDEPVDVVVLDLIMPQMDGVEVLREMKSRDCSAKVILVSGYDDQLLETVGLLAKGYKLHVVGILNKPFAFDAFSALLRSSIGENVH